MGGNKKTLILMPNQLFEDSAVGDFEKIVLVENGRYFSDFEFHKKKLIFHRASMKCYQDRLVKKNHEVIYLDHLNEKKDSLGSQLVKKKIKNAAMYDPVDHDLKRRLEKDFSDAGIIFEFLESPLFICEDNLIKDFFSEDKKHYSMNSFYIFQRKRLGILLDGQAPVGGEWSFDKENRHRLGKGMKIPAIRYPSSNKYVKEAVSNEEKKFGDNPGSAEGFFYPVTSSDAKKWLDDFIKVRLENFGPYEDAISKEERFLFHSLLSPLLNSGLLNAQKVIEDVIGYWEKKNVMLNSIEGFIRQIIGWREFMRGVYTVRGQQQRELNFWGFETKMPKAFYEGTTGIEPVDVVICQSAR